MEYRAPELVAAALQDHAEYQSGEVDVLDAGCGTGLCGPLLRSTARRLVGVDLSKGMIDRARQRTVYDELVIEELCSAMRARPAAFGVVVSADTLVYFGALEEALAACEVCLRGPPAGCFHSPSRRGQGSSRGRLTNCRLADVIATQGPTLRGHFAPQGFTRCR